MTASLYRYFGEDDRLLYVGASHHPFRRETQHELARDMTEVRYIELEWFPSKEDALKAEAVAIKRERPEWNEVHQRKPRRLSHTYEPQGVPGYNRSWRCFAIGDVPLGPYDHFFEAHDAARVLKSCRRGDRVVIGRDVAAPPDILEKLREFQP